MGLVNPLSGAPHQDFVMIGSLATPGKAVIRNAGSPRKWESRGGFGIAGASAVFTGIPLVEFEIDILIWEDVHWVAWEVLAKLYLGVSPGLPSPGPFLPIISPKAVGISHPILTKFPNDIKEVVFTNIGQWENQNDGSWLITLKCMKYAKPKPMLGKADGVIPAAKAVVPTARDAIDAEIAAKRAEMARLAGGGRS